ncbi:MAG: hypothetical protein JWR70_514 [Modestobacter sp.]|nr:hypothetical protein [Modestobacter sp.]
MCSCLQGGGPPLAGVVGEVGLVPAEHGQPLPVGVGGGADAFGGRPTRTVDGGITAPVICARWPKTVRCPIRTGCSRVPTTVLFSRTAE